MSYKRKTKTVKRLTALKRPKVRVVRKVCKDDSKSNVENTSTGILILNDDCFQEIFSYLGGNDILNVIEANTRFKWPCEQVFKRKYCRFVIPVSNTIVFESRTSAHALKHSINTLKHFGHLITKLSIRFKLAKIGDLLDAVAAMCGENLLEFELDHVGIRVLKPSLYANGVEKMTSFLSNLSTQFKKLYRLKLAYQNVSQICPYSDALIRTIPSLTSFETSEPFGERIFTEEKLKEFVRLNRQLERLSFIVKENDLYDTVNSWYISDSFIRCLDESLPMLK